VPFMHGLPSLVRVGALSHLGGRASSRQEREGDSFLMRMHPRVHGACTP
jgi:hypothetical protein